MGLLGCNEYIFYARLYSPKKALWEEWHYFTLWHTFNVWLIRRQLRFSLLHSNIYLIYLTSFFFPPNHLTLFPVTPCTSTKVWLSAQHTSLLTPCVQLVIKPCLFFPFIISLPFSINTSILLVVALLFSIPGYYPREVTRSSCLLLSSPIHSLYQNNLLKLAHKT